MYSLSDVVVYLYWFPARNLLTPSPEQNREQRGDNKHLTAPIGIQVADSVII